MFVSFLLPGLPLGLFLTSDWLWIWFILFVFLGSNTSHLCVSRTGGPADYGKAMPGKRAWIRLRRINVDDVDGTK
jgi:hypothetical protein